MRKTRNNMTQLTGIVTNCNRLNVRSKADKDSDILTTLSAGTELIISDDASNDFYAVRRGSLRGFCMKDYISIQPHEEKHDGEYTDIN